MVQPSPTVDLQHPLLRQMDLVTLEPGRGVGHAEMLARAEEAVTGVFRDFLAAREIPVERITLLDGFLFLFNEPFFSEWHRLSWWEQRGFILALKDHQGFGVRAQRLLSKSSLAAYMDYSDPMVAKSTEPQVKRAWMLKRLALKECFWNGIDSVSHAAYHQKKYRDMYPALCMLLCTVAGNDGRQQEMFFGIDNGTGFLYKKKSRESALFNLVRLGWKCFFRRGVFYIGGLELGLIETESQLSCHANGAVVYQGW
jgi:hypothetical protein